MKYFFTSDPHYDHYNEKSGRGVIGMCARPFTTIDDMNEELIHQTNITVGISDTLIIAGDFAWHNAEKWRKAIKCRNVWLVRGNHDKPAIARAFKHVWDTKMVKFRGHNCFISHYPHIFWPSSHHNSLHLYGHVHHMREFYLDKLIPNRRSMDIGVDAAYLKLGAYRPFSEDEIIGFLGSKEGHDKVEYYVEYQNKLKASIDKLGVAGAAGLGHDDHLTDS